MIKKFLFIALAILLCTGIAEAANIPTGVAPEDGPEIWTMEVYNDSGATLVSGDSVVWDYADDDMYDLDLRKMYVTTTTTADDIATAGIVVDPNIANGDVGTIAIFGPVMAHNASTTALTAGQVCGTTTTARRIADWSDTSGDRSVLGWVVDGQTTGGESSLGGLDICVIFVNPTPHYED